MENDTRILNAAFEYMLTGDYENAAHAFRSFADDLENSGCPDSEDLQVFIHNLNDMLEEHIEY